MTSIQISGNSNSVKNLFSTGVPFFMQPSGSIGNNGALSGLSTNLPETFSGGVYLYFPAAAISAGSAAGWYYCIMSSVTAGTIYNNTYSSGLPVIPASPTAFVTTGPGAYTQTTNEITGPNFTLSGNTMGLNSRLFIDSEFANNNSANNKTMSVKVGSATVWTRSRTTTLGDEPLVSFQNRGSLSKQRYSYSPSSGFGVAQSAQGTSFTVDTTQDQTVSATLQLANASDYLGVEIFIVNMEG